jgi:hypothetical protein
MAIMAAIPAKGWLEIWGVQASRGNKTEVSLL